MKKKLCLSALSCLAFALAVPFTPVNAEFVEITSSSGKTQVVAERSSNYTVLIPRRISFTTAQTAQNFFVKAYGNIAIDEVLSVTVSPSAAMTSGTRTSSASLSLTGASWTGDELKAREEDSLNKTGSATFIETRAGTWSGLATFYIALDKAE